MMKKLLFVFSLLFLFSAAVYCEPLRPYFGLKGGLSFTESHFALGYYRSTHYYDGYPYDRYEIDYDDSYDAVFAGSAFAGLRIMPSLRAEIEYTRRTESRHEYKWFPDINQEFDSFMANVFFDWQVSPSCVPYVGFGMGMTHIKNTVKYKGYDEYISKNRFSAAFDLGISFILAAGLNLDMGFRGAYLGGMEIEREDYYMYAMDFYTGLRYTI